ncbi:MAG: DMT family transporter [Thermoleophilia bacterium]|nr:DMT family transporter [Thermoleophilia bacterium]
MNPALWGLLAAAGWGSADFIARFTGVALGHRNALLGMLSFGALVLSLIVWQAGLPLTFDLDGLWLLFVSGVGTMLGTMLLYWGLARGPVTVVAPIVGSFPAFNLVIGLLRGIRPGVLQWIAMGAVMCGVVAVALAGAGEERRRAYSREHVRRSALLALGSALIFAFTLTAIQEAMPIYGELQTVMAVRWISLLAIALLFLARRETPRVSVSYLPLIAAQGLLDGGAYVALLLGSHGEGAAIAVVVGSAFSAVTVLLARAFLNEAMGRLQWGGIAFIVTGVAVLSA